MTALCVVCGQPVDPDDTHTPHEPGCRYPDLDCTCDLPCHPHCCPCQEDTPMTDIHDPDVEAIAYHTGRIDARNQRPPRPTRHLPTWQAHAYTTGYTTQQEGR